MEKLGLEHSESCGEVATGGGCGTNGRSSGYRGAVGCCCGRPRVVTGCAWPLASHTSGAACWSCCCAGVGDGLRTERTGMRLVRAVVDWPIGDIGGWPSPVGAAGGLFVAGAAASGLLAAVLLEAAGDEATAAVRDARSFSRCSTTIGELVNIAVSARCSGSSCSIDATR